MDFTGSKEIQWQYVRGLFEYAIYGGRVDNVYDVRVLVSYLDEYFNDLVLTGPSPSRKTLCGGLRIPSSTRAQDYLDVINSMPEFDKPVAFGLPGNIERSWQRVVSSQVINQLKSEYFLLLVKIPAESQYPYGRYFHFACSSCEDILRLDEV